MKCTKFKFSLLLIVLMAMVFTMACKTKSEGEFKPKLYYTIKGEALSIASQPLQNVTVEVTDYNMSYSNASKPTAYFGALTDADGAYTLEIISTEEVDNVSLKFSKTGFTPNYLNVGVTAGQTVEKSAMLQARTGFQTIADTTIDRTITGNSGASVTIRANTLVNASGARVSAARVNVTAIDTTSEIRLLPGDQYSTHGGSLLLFSTFGMIEVVAQDVAGNPLNLASGATAAVSIPLGVAKGKTLPATATLWYYDEKGAEWLSQGNLTLNNAGTAYEGTISHFSIFNAGKSFEPAYIKGTIVDQIGDDVYNAEISLFTPLFPEGVDNGAWQSWFTTGPEGDYPSILDTSLLGVVPENMKGYIPIPSGTEVRLYAKYILKKAGKPNQLFEHRETILNAEGEQLAAGETLTIDPILFELSTTAFITGHVLYEHVDPVDSSKTYTPATGMWLRFMDATLTTVYGNFGRVAADDKDDSTTLDSAGTLVNVNGFTETKDPQVAITAETEGKLFMSWGPPSGDLKVVKWTIDGVEVKRKATEDEVEEEGATYFVWGSDSIIEYKSSKAGLGHVHEIILEERADAPVDTSVPMTYVSGTAKMEDGTYAPAGSWVVFKGLYGSAKTPYAIRAQVTDNGVFPDPEGAFPVVTVVGGVEVPVQVVDGVVSALVDEEWIPVRVVTVTVDEVEQKNLETLDGETWVTLEAKRAFYIKVPAATTYTVEIQDVLTDPVNPVVVFTFNFKSGAKDAYLDDLVIGASTTVSGRIYYDGDVGADLLVTFTKVNAVTECVTDKNDPDYDEDCKVDVPVTAITDNTGAYSVKLEMGTAYTVTVSTHDGDTPLDTLYTKLYTSNTDASDDTEQDFTSGIAYEPVATVTGRVVYEGAYGNGLYIKFTKVTPGTEDQPVLAIADEDGKYIADLDPDTDYIVTVYEDINGDVLYPSVAYPGPGGGDLLFTSSDIDSNITDETDKLDIQIGAGMEENPYTLSLPVGKAGVGGTLKNANGTPAAIGTLIYFLKDGGNPQTDAIWAIVNDDKGTYFATTSSFAATKNPVALDPATTYSVRYLNFTTFATTILNTGFTSGSAGLVQTVLVAFPETGASPSTKAYATGTLKNANGTPAAIGTLIYFLKDGGNPQTDAIWAIVNDDKGKYFATTSSFAATGNPVALDSATTYSVRYLNFTTFATTVLNAGFTSGGAGVQQTVLVAFPETGASPSTKAYATGVLLNANGTPAAIGTLIYFLKDGGNPQTDAIWAIVNDDKGTYFATTSSFAATGNPVALDSATTYSVRYLNFTTFATTVLNAGFTSGGAGVQQTVLVAFP